MEFGIEKVAMPIMKSNKKITRRSNLTDNSGNHQNPWKEGTFLALSKIGNGHHQIEMKKKMRNDYLRRTINLLKSKHFTRSLIKVINTCSIPFVKYSKLFLKWTREEL